MPTRKYRRPSGAASMSIQRDRSGMFHGRNGACRGPDPGRIRRKLMTKHRTHCGCSSGGREDPAGTRRRRKASIAARPAYGLWQRCRRRRRDSVTGRQQDQGDRIVAATDPGYAVKSRADRAEDRWLLRLRPVGGIWRMHVTDEPIEQANFGHLQLDCDRGAAKVD